MKILAIDQSLTNLAVCVFENNTLVYQHTYCSPNKGVQRLIDVRTYLTTLKQQQSPDKIVFENYAYLAHGQAIHPLAELGGLIKIWCYDNGFTPLIVSPTALKKFVTGKGNSPKEVVIKDVFKTWQFDTNDNNIADAFALGKFAAHALNVAKTPITKVQQAVIDGFLKEHQL